MESVKRELIVPQPKARKFNYFKPGERKIFKPGKFNGSKEYLPIPKNHVRRKEGPFIQPNFIYDLVKV